MPLPQRPPKPKTLAEANEIIDALWGIVESHERLLVEVAELRAENDELKAQVKELLDKAGKSSRNSSKSPSSDSIAQRANRPKKKRSSRNKGAQPGHEAHQRNLLEESKVDQFERHFPQAQCTCGGTVVVEQDPSFRHQVFDLPEVRYVTVHAQISALQPFLI